MRKIEQNKQMEKMEQKYVKDIEYKKIEKTGQKKRAETTTTGQN